MVLHKLDELLDLADLLIGIALLLAAVMARIWWQDLEHRVAACFVWVLEDDLVLPPELVNRTAHGRWQALRRGYKCLRFQLDELGVTG